MNWKQAQKNLLFIAAGFVCVACSSTQSEREANSDKLLQSLETLTVKSLRQRHYKSDIIVEEFSRDSCVGNNPILSQPDARHSYKSFMASFRSDGLRQYARITVPSITPPENGYPFVLFLHGYIGKDKAPDYSIGCNPENMYYSELTDAFARSGFAVLAPGYRGHATVNAVAAEGIEYMEAFDQGAGLSTQFYAIDALNFAAGISNIDGAKFAKQSFDFDMSQYFLVGHSQGGDAGLTFLSVIGEGHQDELMPVHSALWSGTFLNRLTALEEMVPMTMTAEAFLAGDGQWNGTALGANGEENPNFIYGFPPDWIETPHPNEWSWQNKSFTEPDVMAAISTATETMYVELEEHVEGLEDLSFSLSDGQHNEGIVEHDPRIASVFPQIGGYNYEKYLSENLTLHVPEKDYYSQIAWNQDLCDRIRDKGANCSLVVYPHNNHSMRASPYEWFSPKETEDGYPVMIANMIAEFSKYGGGVE